MAIELARAQAVPKPWGVADLRPWSTLGSERGCLIGEVWYERAGGAASEALLLLKLLFTSQPLSIQVHPDDAYAHSIGMPCGKTEAWYVLNAAPGAKVAIGLKERLASRQLREAVDDGTIVRHVAWRTVLSGDVVFVPAGTIHAIGAGLVIAEIQQRSDVTFRLFDFGRKRDLHVASAIAVANAGPADFDVKSKRLTDERTLLVSNPHFAFERIVLAPGSSFVVEAERETWLLVVGGSGSAGKLAVAMGEAVFAQSDRINIHAGPAGMAVLVAYAGVVGPAAQLLTEPGVTDAGGPEEMQMATSLTRAKTVPTHGYVGKIQ
jgi:mannose-6-phosphate isomerase